MNQTPVDGSNREGRTVGETDRAGDRSSLLHRVASRIKSVGRSLRARLRPVSGQSDEYRQFDSSEPRSLTSADERTRSIVSIGLSEEDGRSARNDLVEARTADSSDREGPSVERPELVVQWNDDELTLSAPDEPDAHITSTHWEDVER
ncbi:hypothetical protein BRD06_08415 [Halobacteriales archaeon QS_9_67_15]|nr:MAG: hypothetical protein BRD06_08415 [Halobacteriales archaeon QS_9_67_15]